MLSLLTVLFIGLKLGSVITWSWWLVCLPTIIEVVFATVVLIIAACIGNKKFK